MFASAAAALFALATTQSAADLVAECESYQAEYGASADCACLVDKAMEDEALGAMFAEITSPEELENAPDEVKEAIEECS